MTGSTTVRCNSATFSRPAGETKLFALCDRGTDLADCVALKPTAEELADALPWVSVQDANPGWPAHVTATFADLQGRVADGF